MSPFTSTEPRVFAAAMPWTESASVTADGAADGDFADAPEARDAGVALVVGDGRGADVAGRHDVAAQVRVADLRAADKEAADLAVGIDAAGGGA